MLAQEYSYVHYDVKDGLAGSTVYDITQDRDGFIWFATEAGVSRFDGTHFKNFTTADGLPETEIIKIFADSWGRVWMAPFKNTLFYYYEGKIHTSKNDSLLRKLQLSAMVTEFVEDEERNLYFQTYLTELWKVKTDSSMNASFESKSFSYNTVGIGRNPFGKGIMFSIAYPLSKTNSHSSYEIYTLIDGKLEAWSKKILRWGIIPVSVQPDRNILTAHLPPKITRLNFSYLWDKVRFVNTLHGSWLIDTLSWTYKKVFLPNNQISKSLVDKEQNYWFATLGQGVYKLVSQEFSTWKIQHNSTSEIFSLQKSGNAVLAGSAFGKFFSFKDGQAKMIDLSSIVYNRQIGNQSNRLVHILPTRNGHLLLSFDGVLVNYDPASKKVLFAKEEIVKSIVETGNDTFLIASARGVWLATGNKLDSVALLSTQRTTTISPYNNMYYVGTPNGLYIYDRNGSKRFSGEQYDPLTHRIASMVKDINEYLWVATFGGGLIQMKGDKPVRQFTTTNGLTSDICRTLFLQDNFLWVGTDKGLNKIDISQPSFPVMRYTVDDGLPSDIINAIYAENDSVYVASPAGLTIFNEKRVTSGSSSELKILDVSVSGRTRSLDSLRYLKYRENSLRFNFVGISFRSGGNILYRYRLKGLNKDWDSTRQTVLEFLSLPSGSYELELIAVNKFGVASSPVSIPFTIGTPFWQTLWFKILIVAAIIFLTWWFVTRRFVAIRKREQEKLGFQSRLNDLEQLALRAQMNPHFIFNCLNSIQNFIIHNDLETTNQYLTEFAHLIRQTLDNAAKNTISIEKEVQYLTHYLEMEKMRFGHSFRYTITVSPLIDQEHTHIPTMILQPYVENSIRHGVRYMENGKGMIEILFEKKNEDLLCIVQDNGIGREKAATLKSSMHVEYQSKGMMLTAERIKALNRTFAAPITIEVIDQKDVHDQPAGTRIVIRFPSNSLI